MAITIILITALIYVILTIRIDKALKKINRLEEQMKEMDKDLDDIDCSIKFELSDNLDYELSCLRGDFGDLSDAVSNLEGEVDRLSRGE